jgi:hypothetical protein
MIYFELFPLLKIMENLMSTAEFWRVANTHTRNSLPVTPKSVAGRRSGFLCFPSKFEVFFSDEMTTVRRSTPSCWRCARADEAGAEPHWDRAIFQTREFENLHRSKSASIVGDLSPYVQVAAMCCIQNYTMDIADR